MWVDAAPPLWFEEAKKPQGFKDYSGCALKNNGGFRQYWNVLA